MRTCDDLGAGRGGKPGDHGERHCTTYPAPAIIDVG